ncbi:MAG: CPBP family intramembrane metalloprotease [Elusimicrobiaceae bacterium]|nr:CPBP family intramembrane metalloprotease [Elusimicrobiaceae bacterium]
MAPAVKKVLAWISCAAALSGAARCAGPEQINAMPQLPAWKLFVPGAGQFAFGEPGKGLLFAAGTAGLLGYGIYSEIRKDAGQLNAPLVGAQQLYLAGLYDTYRSVMLRSGASRYTVRFDPAPVSKLAAAPFSREAFSPWVIGVAAVGAGLNYALARGGSHRGSFRSVSGISYLGNSYNRDTGAAVLGAQWLGVSWGAGVSEEMLFRGILQAQWERRFGDTAGLLAASAVFGAAHLADPSSSDSWYSAGFACLAGVYFGTRYRANNYTLSEVIASHAWFDIAAGFASYLADPEENPLGAKIRFPF